MTTDEFMQFLLSDDLGRAQMTTDVSRRLCKSPYDSGRVQTTVYDFMQLRTNTDDCG